MIYWLFKKYMKRLVDEYAEAYDKRAKETLDPAMRPDVYWLQQHLDGKLSEVTEESIDD